MASSIREYQDILWHQNFQRDVYALFYVPFARKAIALRAKVLVIHNFYEHPLVAPHVSHFSQVPLRTMVKFEHSEHMLPV